MDRKNTYKYTYTKAKLTLSVDKNLIQLAKDNKINISRFLEEKLNECFAFKKADAAGFESVY
jgi:post-segregation antitoxin (ccd killing protein)